MKIRHKILLNNMGFLVVIFTIMAINYFMISRMRSLDRINHTIQQILVEQAMLTSFYYDWSQGRGKRPEVQWEKVHALQGERLNDLYRRTNDESIRKIVAQHAEQAALFEDTRSFVPAPVPKANPSDRKMEHHNEFLRRQLGTRYLTSSLSLSADLLRSNKGNLAELSRLESLYRTIVSLLLAFLMIWFIVLLLALLRSIDRPIQRLLDGLRRISAGHFEFQIPSQGHDEFAMLAQGFNQMSQTMASYRKEIEAKLLAEVKLSRQLSNEMVERERLEVFLRQECVRSEAANEAKSRFIASISHELRTPLNAVIGFSELILLKKPKGQSDDITVYVQKIALAGRHLLDLVNDILQVTSQELGQVHLNKAVFPFTPLVHEAISLHRGMAASKHISIEEPASDAGLLYTERRSVLQILSNLLTNAIKYTPQNGQVGIRVRAHESAIEFEVWDNGVGIPQESLDLIFQEFTQIDNNGNTSFSGVGLGLAITKKLVDLLEGSIHVESSEHRGSTFSVTLPRNLPSTELLPAADGARDAV